jgi:hypothetical protein
MPPRTPTISSGSGHTSISAPIRSIARGRSGVSGARRGLSLARMTIIAVNIAAESRPGRTPATKSLPTDVPAKTAYTTIRIEGGISEPSVPAEATQPVARPGSYLCLSISGTAMRLMPAAVATDDPEAAAKSVQAATLATASPPGTPPSATRIAWNNDEVSRVSVQMKPISMNIGTAESDQSPISSNGTAVNSEKPTRQLVITISPPTAIPPSATPIGTRSAIRTSSTPKLR